MTIRIYTNILLIVSCIAAGCANISTPSGGKRDVTPPKLLLSEPGDSLTNTRVTKVVLRFDEYVTLGDVQKEITISPILSVPPIITSLNKHVTVKIADSLLEESTTYRISFGNAIRDMHEGNAYTGYTYTFSTGAYFDSLRLKGTIIDAATGKPDTTSIVVLYNATENDSAVVKKKPRYASKTDASGKFRFEGLPGRAFKIYAIRDDNNNQVYDGGSEMIAFADNTVSTTDTTQPAITLRLFSEKQDTAQVSEPTTITKKSLRNKEKPATTAIADTNLVYTVNVDTSNINSRTFGVTDSVKLSFNRKVTINADSISLTYDSAGKAKSIALQIRTDTSKSGLVIVKALLNENTVYTLKVNKGFAKDTAERHTIAGVYRFRTLNNDDYGKITLNIPVKYQNRPSEIDTNKADNLLLIKADNDTLSLRKIADTNVRLTRLRPATYTFCIIVDKNKNGKWDTGDLYEKKQPELVIPADENIILKAKWEHTIDFEHPVKQKDKKPSIKGNR